MPTRVLLADPDEIIIEAFARSFVRYGFEVLTASNERDLVRHLCEAAHDVLVWEPNAGAVWGLLLAAHDNVTVPVVVLSRVRPDEVKSALPRSVRWLTKPVRTETLVRAVREALREPIADEC
jgi:DNA-binding NtrC family response regulator